MAKNLGVASISTNFQVKYAGAIDPRVLVDTKTDLINPDSWPHEGETYYVYNGLIVAVVDTHSIYMLVDSTKITEPDYSGWAQLDASAATSVNVVNSLDSDSATDALAAAQGKALNTRLTAVEGKITSIFTFKGTKASEGELPEEENVAGDVWLVTEDSSEYVWTGSAWEKLGFSVDLSSYATKEYVDGKVSDLDTAYKAADQIINQSIQTLTQTVNNKVDKVEGSSLVPDAKIALIDTNASKIEELETAVEGVAVKSVTETAVNGINLDLSEEGALSLNVELDTLVTDITGNANMNGSKIKVGAAINNGVTISADETISAALTKIGAAINSAVAGGITSLGSTDNSITVTGEGTTRDLKVNVQNIIKSATNLAVDESGKLNLVWIEA